MVAVAKSLLLTPSDRTAQPEQALASGLARPFFQAWLSMLALLLATYALIPIAREPGRHHEWFFWPVIHASLLGAVLGVLALTAGYMLLSRWVSILTTHGSIVLSAAALSGLGCAFVVFGAERHGPTQDYSPLLTTAGQITAAILIAFVIEQRYAPAQALVTRLDIVGFAYIVTSMGTSILGNYPVGQHWQASMGVVTCMGAGAGIATLALRASELPLNNRS